METAKKVQRIVSKMFSGHSDDRYGHNLDLSFELLNMGPVVVDPLLDILIGMAGSGSMLINEPKLGYPVAHLIRTVAMNATPANSKKIGELLTSPEILNDGRVRRGPLVRALGRVGDSKSADILMKYSYHVSEKVYPDIDVNPETFSSIELSDAEGGKILGYHFRNADKNEIAAALAEIKSRI